MRKKMENKKQSVKGSQTVLHMCNCNTRRMREKRGKISTEEITAEIFQS